MSVASVWLGMAVLAAQAPAPGQLPTFRTGVDVVELDVTVLDRERRPVRGLTADDFTILERGTPQPIVAFSAVEVPAPVAPSAPWLREAPYDVVANADHRRLVTIVMDDAYTALEPDVVKRAKQIARNAVDELGPADLAAVVFTFLGRAQNFTSDRAQLAAAIDSFTPKTIPGIGPPAVCMPIHRSCDVDTLSTVASTLLAAPPGRKVVVLVSGGRSFTFGQIGSASSRNESSELVRLFQNLQRANVTVYAFDAHGLQVSRPANDSLASFAASTGGRAVVDTNDPAGRVAEALRESSSYYLVGFRSSDPSRGGGFRKIEVKVNRRGVEVRTRNGYYPARTTEPASKDAPMNGLPGGALRLHVTAAPVAVPGGRGAEVIVAARLDRLPAASGAAMVDLSATAIDMDSKVRGTERQTVQVTPRPGARTLPDLHAHLPLPAGRYMIRLNAETGEFSGTVFVDVDVPDFDKDPLSASGLLLQRTPTAAVADKAIASLVPVAPTTVRAFEAGDDVTVFLRVYQGGKGRVVPVRMTARVTNGRNETKSNQEAVLESALFGVARAADYRVTLPLAHLTAGEYLLEIMAQSGARKVRRTARFEVVDAR